MASRKELWLRVKFLGACIAFSSVYSLARSTVEVYQEFADTSPQTVIESDNKVII